MAIMSEFRIYFKKFISAHTFNDAGHCDFFFFIVSPPHKREETINSSGILSYYSQFPVTFEIAVQCRIQNSCQAGKILNMTRLKVAMVDAGASI